MSAACRLRLRAKRATVVTLQTFSEQWQPRYGTRNPERMDLAYWVEMVRCGETAWAARQRLDPRETLGGWQKIAPVWCFHRFGSTRTRLPDGSVVCVAGEHEDHYDPDFCIYNDVVVLRPGGKIEIYGYPADFFPPTDFHTATLIGDVIWLIGSLGYGQADEDRARTQVLALDTSRFRLERVATRGEDPGWLSGHRAARTGDMRIRVWGGKRREKGKLVANTGCFEFDHYTHRWHPAGSAPADAGAEIALARLPQRLDAMDEEQAILAADVLRATTAPGHPLFGVEVWPIAEDRTTLACLVRLEDGTGRYALCEVPYSETRQTLPAPRTLLFVNLERALTALPSLDHERWQEFGSPSQPR